VSRKVYEVAFEIAGKLDSGFGGTFQFASARISRLKLDLQELNKQYKSGSISMDEFSAKQSIIARQIREVQRANELLNRSFQKQNELMRSFTTGAFGMAKNSLLLGGGAAIAGGGLFLGSSLKKSMDYEAQLASIQALTGISNEELAKMDALALKMGADTKYSALQAAQGIEELLKAGMTPATVQAGGLEAALNLATAGGLDLTEAATVMSDALNGFKKDGMSAADAANILAGAANASSTDVHKLAESLQAVGPVADMIGVSFKGVNATLAAFSNNNLKGSDAGTSLKTMLMNLQPQTKQATALFQKYGLITAKGANIFFQANGELKDMAEVAGILHDKFAKLNDQQRADAFFNLFGSDAVRAASILFKEGAAGIQQMYKDMADVTALEVAKKKMDTAAGSVEQFKGAVETLQIRALRPLLPLIKKVFNEAGDIVERVSPRITDAVQHAVDSAKNYLKSHFIDNPDFQRLDAKGKFEFVVRDFKSTFDAWYNAGGNQQISDAVKGLIRYISDAMDGSSEELTSIGAKLGKSIASGMLTGLEQFAKENPKLAAILTFAATPGPLQVKFAAAIGVGTGTLPAIVDAGKEVAQGVSSDVKVLKDQGIGAWWKNFQQSVANFFSTPDVRDANGKKLIGKELVDWQKAHSQLNNNKSGETHITINAPFQPNVSSNDAIPALKEEHKNYVNNLENMFRQQKRLSLDE
jgi:TP901 family phage tail tape measure protein